MSTEQSIICRRLTAPQYTRGQSVIKANETSERTAVFQHYAEAHGYAYIRYGDEQPVLARHA